MSEVLCAGPECVLLFSFTSFIPKWQSVGERRSTINILQILFSMEEFQLPVNQRQHFFIPIFLEEIRSDLENHMISKKKKLMQCQNVFAN